jgi:UDP-GlcNAc:undecaprenyl-phosphate GlcNAc-1-phosphate transferase
MRLSIWPKEGKVRSKFQINVLGKYDYLPMLIGIGVLVIPQVRRGFMDIGLRWVYILSISFAMSFALTPVFGWLAARLDVIDQPNERKVHLAATPLLGGAAVFIAFLVSILLNGIFTTKLGIILIAATILFTIGVLDDVKELPAGTKLAAQLLCSALVMGAGIYLKVIPNSLGWFAHAGNLIITLFWIVGITNAMNFFDGMDGLAAGLGAIISFFLGVVAFQTEQPFLGWVAVAMMGCCIGFLPYNFRMNGKAVIFLGDAGSTVIGFILACVAVYGNWSETSPIVAFASPLLIFWLLIFDMVHITVDRILSGKVLNLRQWVEYVGKDHLHHRIAVALGCKKKSVLFIYLMSCCLGASAVLLRSARTVDALILLIQALIMVILITILERRGRNIVNHNRQDKHS